MSAVGSLNHVALSVRDLEKSTRFYEHGLGMRKTLTKQVGKNTWKLLRLPPDATGQSVFLQGPTRSGQIELIQWNLDPDFYAPRTGVPPLIVLSFPVEREDIHAVYARLAAMGAECFCEPTVNRIENYGDVTMFTCLDPDGHLIEIMNLPSIEEVRAFRAAQSNAAKE